MKKVTVITNKRECIRRGICWKHEAKMKNMLSYSTDPTENTRCIENRKNDNWICAHCYSFRLIKARARLKAKLEKNTFIATCCAWTRADVENIIDAEKHKYFRFEAFADLQNTLQVKNYFTFARYNKNVKCALWTKSPDLVEKAIKRYNLKKPRNLQIVYSYPRMNTGDGAWIFKLIHERYPFVSKVFIVNEKPIAKTNCMKECYKCLKCYEKNTVKVIYENLK